MTAVWTSTAGNDQDLELEEGQVCRVISIIDDSSALIELRNGNTGKVTAVANANLSVGDVFFCSEQNVTRLPPSAWPAGDRTGTIAWADDDNVIVKSSASTFAFPQRQSEPFRKGQTVRLGPDGQPIDIIADQPIEAFDLSHMDSFDIESLIVKKEDNETTLADFGGSSPLVRRATDLVSVALEPSEPLRAMGVNPIKGILFSGPSGTGKTHLAKGLANLTNASFYNISGPAIVDQFVGQTERRLRDIFDHANKNGPAILFFDEIDSLYTQRGDRNHEATNRLVGQFLALLDGFVSYERVLIIATTNLPGALDSALMRPGRLGHKLIFTIPSEGDRVLILKASSRKIVFSEEPDLNAVARATTGWPAADLAAIWTEAGIAAALDGRKAISGSDVRAGVEAQTCERNVRLRENK
jgi:transitional endoplasmic reticulum ATPase